jgi:hypothetical protein
MYRGGALGTAALGTCSSADPNLAGMPARVSFLIVLVLTASGVHAQTATGTLSGTVRDETGRPVREALVVIDAETTPMRARTSNDGTFRIAQVPVGGHELQVVRIGFRPHRSRISVPASGLNVEVTLEHAPMLLDTIAVRVARTGVHGTVVTRGIALLPHEPRPLRGATIEVLKTPFRSTSSADGRFSFGELTEGAYSLLVRIDRYQSRIVPAYVPPDGGVELHIVLDSTIADWQRREDMELREISRRLREASNPSAFVSAAELAFPTNTTLKDALRETPSTLSRGLLLHDNVTCIYVDGEPRPGMTAGDVLAEDVHAVEVYGINARGGTQAPGKPWQSGTFCGTGTRQGPLAPMTTSADMPRGYRLPERQMDNIARVAVIWLKRKR